jgi:hypothetical protein
MAAMSLFSHSLGNDCNLIIRVIWREKFLFWFKKNLSISSTKAGSSAACFISHIFDSVWFNFGYRFNPRRGTRIISSAKRGASLNIVKYIKSLMEFFILGEFM